MAIHNRRSVDEHIEFVCSLAQPHILQNRPVSEATDHFLASDVYAALPVPRFSNSAMDGFTVHADDLSGGFPVHLPVAGEIAAGSDRSAIPRGRATRIMTGAPIEPEDGVMVVPVEETNIPRGPVPLPDEVVIYSADPQRSHIRVAGENVQPGQMVAQAGTKLHAGTVAALISTGIDAVDYVRLPNVTVISTGDELALPGEALQEFQIPNSNGPMLRLLATANGAGDVQSIHVADDPDVVRNALAEAAETSDIVVTSGGVSAGAFDVMREVAAPSADMWFGNVSQRPGSPQGAGLFNGKPLVCLPGNPVAAWVSFHLYVAPLIARASGATERLDLAHRPQVVAALAGPPLNIPHDRVVFTPVRVVFAAGQITASTVNNQIIGSGFVASLPGCNGLAMATQHNCAGKYPVLLTTQ